jgi:cytosolic 5'-nucleotidase 3
LESHTDVGEWQTFFRCKSELSQKIEAMKKAGPQNLMLMADFD